MMVIHTSCHVHSLLRCDSEVRIVCGSAIEALPDTCGLPISVADQFTSSAAMTVERVYSGEVGCQMLMAAL